MSDAMKDLGSLPEKAIGIRNRMTKQEFHKNDLDWIVWNNILRHAYNHQDEIDILMEEAPVVDVVSEELDVEVGMPVKADGAKVVEKKDLRLQHYKKLQAMCKENGLDVTGSKEALVERLLKVL